VADMGVADMGLVDMGLVDGRGDDLMKPIPLNPS